jgi:hypothetical protein
VVAFPEKKKPPRRLRAVSLRALRDGSCEIKCDTYLQKNQVIVCATASLQQIGGRMKKRKWKKWEKWIGEEEDEEMQLRVWAPCELIALADRCAFDLNVSLSFFTRVALAAALEAEGVTPPVLKPPSVRKARFFGNPKDRHAIDMLA